MKPNNRKVEDVFPEAANMYGMLCAIARICGTPQPPNEQTFNGNGNYYRLPPIPEEQIREYESVLWAGNAWYEEHVLKYGDSIGDWNYLMGQPGGLIEFPTNFSLSPENAEKAAKSAATIDENINCGKLVDVFSEAAYMYGMLCATARICGTSQPPDEQSSHGNGNYYALPPIPEERIKEYVSVLWAATLWYQEQIVDFDGGIGDGNRLIGWPVNSIVFPTNFSLSPENAEEAAGMAEWISEIREKC